MLLAPCSLFISSSCSDLDEHLYDEIAAENHEFTEDDVARMFGPVYNKLQEVFWGWFGYSDVAEMSSDAWCVPNRIGVGWGDLYIPLHRHEFNQDMDFFGGNWDRNYSAITTCNKLLENDVVKGDAAAVAQLRCYRAMYYYHLLDFYRNVPLDTTFSHPDGWLAVQAPQKDVFDYIVRELNACKGQCGVDVTSSKNRFNKFNDYAINFLLAKMYINHNSWFHDDSDLSWYDKAIEELNAVMAGPFDLAPNYLDNFREDISGSPELIFGIKYEDKHVLAGNYSANLWISEPGRAVWGFNGWATGGGAVYEQFLDTYDPDDQRLTDCWTGGQQIAKDGSKIMVDGEPLIYTRTMHSIDGCFPYEAWRMIKYEIVGGDKGTTCDDQVMMRLADVYLMKAECELRLGKNTADAADLVTKVRLRNFSKNPSKATVTVAQLMGGSCYNYGHWENKNGDNVTDPDDFRHGQYQFGKTHAGSYGKEEGKISDEMEGGADIIMGGLLDEYGWEFVGEGQRRQVLQRFKLQNGMSVWNGKSWFCKDKLSDAGDTHYDAFPLYKETLQGNLNLKQNPGY